eukprot:gene4706-biopygen10038
MKKKGSSTAPQMSTLAEPVPLQHRVRPSGCTIVLSFSSQATRKGRISAIRCSSVLGATVEGAAGARLDVIGTRSQPFLPMRCNRRHLGVSATPEDAGAHPVFKTNSNVRGEDHRQM